MASSINQVAIIGTGLIKASWAAPFSESVYACMPEAPETVAKST